MQVWSILAGILVGMASSIGLAQTTDAQQRAASPTNVPPTEKNSIQWASRVVGVSSEKKGEPTGEQYKATQALGRPSKTPEMGESTCAWAPFYADGTADEWIQVGFETPIQARQIIIAENVNPGAVVNVIVIDEKGKEHSVYQATSVQTRQDPLLRIFPKDSAYLCSQIKVVLNGAALKGMNQIDAIGISEDTKPVAIGINVSKNTPKDIQKENLGKTVNSPGQEVAPVISPDGRTLYFTRNFNKANMGASDRQDVWYSTLESASNGNPPSWSEAVNIGSPINNAGDNAISGMAPDGRTAYLINVYRPDGGMSFGISKSIRTKAGWSQPVECRIANNYNLHEKNQLEFCVSPDGKAIILAVQRKDTRGNRDLYVSLQKPDNTWSEPVSLGGVVNTAEFESSPFLAADGRTLYFTSAGHPGYGNGDIFVSRRQDDSWGNWSEPENLGPAINTDEWDGYFTIPASGDFAYLSSRAGSLGEDDIFRLKLFPAIKPDPVAIISGQVLDSQSKKPVASEVASGLFGDTKEISKVDYNPETGEYKIILPTQKVYNLKAKKDGYFTTTEILDLSKDKRFRDIKRTLYLVKIEPGQKIVMREVLFQQSQFALLPGANSELDQMVSMLEKYPAMELLIEGHTDNQGDWEPNMKLSEDRVRVVKEYLISKGISENASKPRRGDLANPLPVTKPKRSVNKTGVSNSRSSNYENPDFARSFAPMSVPLSRNSLVLLSALLVLALGLRLYRVGTYGIYFDEKSTLLISQAVCLEGANQKDVFSKPYFTPAEFWKPKTIHDFIEANIRGDIGNSPAYYGVLWLWLKVFGLSDASLRMPSVIFSTLIIWLLFVFVRRHFRPTHRVARTERAGLLAVSSIDTIALTSAAIAAIEPFFVAYSHIARNYSMTFFLTLLATHIFLLILERVRSSDRYLLNSTTSPIAWLYLAYGAVFVTAVLSHYLAVTVFLCHGVYALFYLRNGRAWVTLGITGIVGLGLISLWFLYGGGTYTFYILEEQKNFYRNLALTNPLHNGFGIILPATIPNITVRAIPVFSDLFIVTNGLSQVLGGVRNSLLAIGLGTASTVIMHRYFSVSKPPIWVYAAVTVLLLAGIPFYTLQPIRLLVLSIAIPFIYLIGRFVVERTDSDQKRFVVLLCLLAFIPTLFLLFMAWRSGHTYGITQRYSGFSFPYVCILVSLGLYQLTSLRWWFTVPIAAVLLIQAGHIVQILGDIYADTSPKYTLFGTPRIANPYRSSAQQLIELYAPGDTILYPNKKRIIYSEKNDKTFSPVSLYDAQLVNVYLPKDAQYIQRVDPNERDRIVLVKGNSDKKITIFDFQGTTYRYGD